MKKSIKIMGIAAMVLLLAVSCKKENKNGFNGETKFMTFSAGISQGNGKTYLNDHTLLWSDEDQIRINNNDPFTLKSGAGSSKGEFEGEAAEAETYYAVYPATGTIDNGIATVTLPAEQPYVAGSFAKGIAPMVAMTNDSKAFTFTNVCGLLRLNVNIDGEHPVKRVELQTRGTESLAGTGTVEIADGENAKLVIDEGTSRAIAVTSSTGISGNCQIVFVLPAGALGTGFSVNFYADETGDEHLDLIESAEDWTIAAGVMHDVTVGRQVTRQASSTENNANASTTTSLDFTYTIHEAFETATMKLYLDKDLTQHVVGYDTPITPHAKAVFQTGTFRFTGLSPETNYYAQTYVKSVGEEVEEPHGPAAQGKTLGNGDQVIEESEDIPVVKPIVDGHQFVDLGLPSGRLWATCNVGAENDYDYGDYYAWGEILPYYADGHSRDNPCNDWREMTTCAGNTDISSGYAWHTYSKGGTSNTLTEWSPEPYDNDYVLKPAYDVATKTWGEGWCMPTVADFDELKANTDRTWYPSGNTEFNGVAGMKCVSKTDPTKFIFLPGASYRKDDKFWGTSGISTSGYYWANSCKVNGTKNADQLTFTSSNTFAVSSSGSPRFRGCTVRPVVKKVTE